MQSKWYIALDTEGFRAEAKYYKFCPVQHRHYYQYRFYCDEVLIAEGKDFSPAPALVDYINPAILTKDGAVNLLSFFTIETAELKAFQDEQSDWATDKLIEWSKTERHEDLVLLVYDLEEGEEEE